MTKSFNIVADGVNNAWLQLVTMLNQEGKESAPRDKKIKEALNVSVKITNPKKRLLTLPVRRISLPFAFGELIWYLKGQNDLETMLYYSRAMKGFSDDGETLNSAYGYRIFGHHPQIGFDQWEHVVSKLKEDPDSRQAIIHLHTPNNKPTKDEVCTLSLQFMIRESKLDMIVNMRSNDAVWGFTYDVFAFTTFQELIANQLQIGMGDYYHNAGSMHMYEKDFYLFDEVDKHLEALLYMTKYDQEFDYEGLTLQDKDFTRLFINEENLRTGNMRPVLKTPVNKKLQLMSDILELYGIYKRHGAKSLVDILEHDNIYHVMMRNYIFGMKQDSTPLLLIAEGPDGAGKSTYLKKFQEENPSFQRLNFKKPTEHFDKLIYFHTAFSPMDMMLDRFIYSEAVYSKVFDREPLISETDYIMIQRILKKRHALLVWMKTDADVCYSRLDKEDRNQFSKEDVYNMREAYYDLLDGSILDCAGKIVHHCESPENE